MRNTRFWPEIVALVAFHPTIKVKEGNRDLDVMNSESCTSMRNDLGDWSKDTQGAKVTMAMRLLQPMLNTMILFCRRLVN